MRRVQAATGADTHFLTVHVPFVIARRGGRKVMVVPDGGEARGNPARSPRRSRHDATLIKALARAFRWQRLLESGAFATLQDLAVAEKINPSYLSRVMRLTLLAPAIVEAILDGRQGAGVTLAGVLGGVAGEWGRQTQHFVPTR